MNVKRSLENRFRGWFPQEPYLFSRGCRVDAEVKNPPLMIPQDYNLRATRDFVSMGKIWVIIFAGYLLFFFFSEGFSVLDIFAWSVAGAAIGFLSGTVSTKRELCRISKEYYTTSINGKDLLLLNIAPFIAFMGLEAAVEIWIIPGSSLYGSLFSLFAWVVSLQAAEYRLLRSYEKKENMLIMSKVGGGRAVVPKPPKQKMSLKQGSELKKL
jgi:hypothetical protein